MTHFTDKINVMGPLPPLRETLGEGVLFALLAGIVL